MYWQDMDWSPDYKKRLLDIKSGIQADSDFIFTFRIGGDVYS
jgi:hypothetical protein